MIKSYNVLRKKRMRQERVGKSGVVKVSPPCYFINDNACDKNEQRSLVLIVRRNQFAQVWPRIDATVMAVTENQLHAIRPDRMDFGDAQSWQWDIDGFSSQPKGFTLCALTLAA